MTFEHDIDRSLEPELYPFPRFEYSYPDEHPWPKEYKYKLALVPMNIPINFFEHYNDGERKLLRIKKDHSGTIKKMILERSENAIRLGAKIIVFNEFSYPILEHSSLKSDLTTLCEKSNAFIIAGTFHEIREHDPKYGFSKCPIYFINGKITYQYKNEPGSIKGIWEEIKKPHLRTLQVIQSRYGLFTIPICIDFLDANLHHNLKLLNKRGSLYHPIDFMIIPSYTDDSKRFNRLCEKVSRDSNMCIIYINNFSDTISPQVFLGGSSIKERAEVPISSDEHQKIYLYEIDLIKVRLQRLFGENVDISEA